MTDLVMVCPSRERPDSARELAETLEQTCTAETQLLVAVDDNDPRLDDYRAAGLPALVVSPSRTMGEALAAAVKYAMGDPPFAIGFLGDDHRPTRGWDSAYLNTLKELRTGMVYGNDLLQGENLPTQVAMTSDIVAALGHMAPPPLVHLYFDNYWRDLGRAASCIRYLPDVIVEHLHPFAGKADWDAGYVRVNQRSMYERDQVAYKRYLEDHFAADVAKVKALRASK